MTDTRKTGAAGNSPTLDLGPALREKLIDEVLGRMVGTTNEGGLQ